MGERGNHLPDVRPLKVFSHDPIVGGVKSVTINVPYEQMRPGPITETVAVIDYDASNDCFYPPANLDDPKVLLQGGISPSETDPGFHQQMVYAVVQETMRRFQHALGRTPKWHRSLHGRLSVWPHAMQQANAFYSRDLKGLAFGYFPASKLDPGSNMPGQVVYTCLSHDIIAHETAHALVDGQKAFFLEQTSLDSPAFHEAFADIVALFQHFTYKETLLDVIFRTGGLLYRSEIQPDARPAAGGAVIEAEKERPNPLVGLAQQFGEAMGTRKALRSALGTRADPADLARFQEPHERGAILVAAVFDAFFSIYVRRTRDLMRIARAGGPVQEGDLHPDLANRLADEAVKTAEHFSNICIRALDYCPPIDIRFGDFLRAMITADDDVVPDDPYGYRSALIDAFRARGIRPEGVASYAEDGLLWLPPEEKDGKPLPACEGLQFDVLSGETEETREENAQVLHDYAVDHRDQLHLDPEAPIQAYSFHAVHRVGADGKLQLNVVVELMQKRENVPLDPTDPASPTVTFRGGTTLILDHVGNVRYAIWKPLGDDSPDNQRLADQREYWQKRDAAFASRNYEMKTLASGQRPLSLADDGEGQLIRFDLLHRGY